MLQPLEPRRLLSFSLATDGTLTVSGGVGNDYLNVYLIKDSVAVQENGEVTAAFKQAKIKRVVLFGSFGNDTIVNSTNYPSLILGGDGNDTLQNNGAGTAEMYGGDGNDTLKTTGTGICHMYGGAGNDNLTGGPGNDLLSPDAGTVQAANGSGGRNTLVLPPAGSTANNRSNIQVTQPNTYLPPNSTVPASLASISTSVKIAKNKAGHSIVTITYTPPNNKADALFGTEVINVGNVYTIDAIVTGYTGTSKPTTKKYTVTYDLGTPAKGYSVKARGLTGSAITVKP